MSLQPASAADAAAPDPTASDPTASGPTTSGPNPARPTPPDLTPPRPSPARPPGQSTAAKLVRFVVVGGVSAALDLGLLVALRELAGVPVAVATTVAFWAALLVNFGLNRAWAFGAGGGGAASVGAPLARYLVLVGINYVATLTIVTGGVALGVPYAVGKVAAIGLGALWTYVAYDRWVFREAGR